MHRGARSSRAPSSAGFSILRLVGAGGMGAVYEAHDPDLDRRVAVKLLKAPEAGGGGVRLVREAQALAQLAHAHVVAVHEVDTDGDQVYVVMELVDGTTLGEAWRRRTRAASCTATSSRRTLLVDQTGRVRVTGNRKQETRPDPSAVSCFLFPVSCCSSDRTSERG